MELAKQIKDVPTGEENHSVHRFLNNVVITEPSTKIGNLRDDE